MNDKRFSVTQTILGSGIYDFQAEDELCESYDEDAYGEVCKLLNELHEENQKIKSMLLKKVEELNDAYNKSAKAGMPTGGIIGELYTLQEICIEMGWL